MMTNERIEELLKNANLWFHTNTYFWGVISDLNKDTDVISENKKISSRYLINLTENDIIIIPLMYSGVNEELFTEETIDICSGDVEKVVVVPQNGYYYRLEVRKNDGETIKIVVNLSSNEFQRKNIIKFVENFDNEGAESLFREELKPRISDYDLSLRNKVLGKMFTLIVFIMVTIVFGIILNLTLRSEYLVVVDMIVLLITIISPIIFIFSAIHDATKSPNNNGSVSTSTSNNKPSFNQMTQEQREEVREKRSEDILTSGGPIASDDENYGGIKKM